MVKKARHRLDGIVYAIKVSKTAPRKNSHDEKMAMNEVFAHAALMKHKHVVRYYNSWVEKGSVSDMILQRINSLNIFYCRFTSKMSFVREEACRKRLKITEQQGCAFLRQS